MSNIISVMIPAINTQDFFFECIYFKIHFSLYSFSKEGTGQEATTQSQLLWSQYTS